MKEIMKLSSIENKCYILPQKETIMNDLFQKIKLFEKISNNSYKKIKKIAENFSEFTIEQLKDLNPSYAKNEAQNIINFVISSYDKMPAFVKENDLQPLVQKLTYFDNLLNYEKDYKSMIPHLKQAADIIDILANKHDQSNDWAINLHKQAKFLSRIPEIFQDALPKGSSMEDYQKKLTSNFQQNQSENVDSQIETAISSLEKNI
jgi:hypothetical protein